MGLIRLIIIIALAWLVWRMVKTALTANSKRATPRDTTSRTEKMVRCAECGVHTPQSEAFFHKHLSFCSPEHQQAYLENHRE